MAASIQSLLEQIERSKCSVLLRNELQGEIWQAFPYGKVPRWISDLETITLTFFSNIGKGRLVTFALEAINATCQPEIVRDFYSETTKQEVQFLATKIHSDKAKDQVFFTFRQIWVANAKLKIVSGNVEVECETLESDSATTVEQFFQNLKPVFEHHKKHDRVKAEPGDYESPLSCYDGNDNSDPQDVLDKSIKIGDRYYGWDPENKVTVVFYGHVNNKYHGHDLPEDDVPNAAKQYINRLKNGGRL